MGKNKKAFKIKTEYYFHCKNETAKARKEYKYFVQDSRKILKYENQLDCDRDYYLNKALDECRGFYVIDDGTHPFYTDPKNENNRKSFYNKYLISPRRMNYNALRKAHAEKCLELKNKIKRCQRLEEKARQGLLDYFDNRTVWFVASVRDVLQEVPEEFKKFKGLSKDYKYENHDSVTWGFYYDLGKALNTVHNNISDINEAGYYDYAVIEPHDVGLLGIGKAISNTLWFKAEYEERKTEAGTPYKCCVRYVECPTPSWAEHTVGWCLN